MIYREFGKTGWKVSAIGMGTWNIGNQWGEISDAQSYETIRSAFDAGVNLFDTAESYGIPNGLSEKRLGAALSGVRHRSYIVSKIGHWGARTGQSVPKTTADMIRLCVHASLYRLRSDWVDVMLCHENNPQNPDVYLEAFEILKKEGEIREYGISTNELESLKRFNVNGTCGVVEVDYSLLNRRPEEEMLNYCIENGIAVLARGPLAQGILTGKYNKETVFTDSVRLGYNEGRENRELFLKHVEKAERIKRILSPNEDMAEMALRYVISHPSCPVAIPGAKSAAQTAKNAAAGSYLLTPAQLQALQEA